MSITSVKPQKSKKENGYTIVLNGIICASGKGLPNLMLEKRINEIKIKTKIVTPSKILSIIER